VALSKNRWGIKQNVTKKGNVRRHILNTRIRRLPGSGRVVTARYPDPVPGKMITLVLI